MARELVEFPNGKLVRPLGLGTWFMGEDTYKRAEEIAVIQEGIRSGVQVIDTAEMYGNGQAESLVGEALKGLSTAEKKNIFLVSKVLPSNAGKDRIFKACEKSLRRTGVDALDLYLLHWRGGVPLVETIDCMEKLVQEGKIKAWGVSNLDVLDMEELFSVRNGLNCQVDQVLYHLGSRGIEFDLKPMLDDYHIPLMAYCPLAQGGQLRSGILRNPAVKEVAKRHGCKEIQVLLAFVLASKQTIAIPKVSRMDHLKEVLAVENIVLSNEDLELLQSAYPSPTHKMYLDIQ